MVEFQQYESRLERPVTKKLLDFQRHGRLKHMLFGEQLTPQILQRFRRVADMIRLMARQPESNRRLKDLLAHKRAMLYFTQPSTRTFLSFMAACQILGITCNEVRDPKTSSEVKRESPADSIRMFRSYFDVIIMRSPISRFAESCAYLMNDLESNEMRSVPIINAGSGSDEHPTQALLDMYTILRTFEFDESEKDKQSRFNQLREKYTDLTQGPANKTYAFCGDIGRGRTVRSLASVLAQYENVRMIFVAPDHEALKMDSALRERLQQRNVELVEVSSLDAEHDGQPILTQIDCLYMTRIQREHNSNTEEGEIGSLDLSQFQLTPQRVSQMKDYAPILHPFPRDSVVKEIPVEVDADPRAMYFRQARNGMWARAALLIHLFDASESLYEAFEASR